MVGSYPGWHTVSVRIAVVEVEDEDCEQDTAGHHPHDKVEIGSCMEKLSSLIGVTSNKRIIRYVNLPTKGTASLVIGISSETIFIKTVRESITVTPKHTKY